jgi:hypothetical protein
VQIKSNEVVNMPKVTIVKPHNTPEQEKKALRNVASVIEKIILEEYGIKTNVTIKEKVS